MGVVGMPVGSSRNKPPRYPAEARRRREEGTVGLLVEIREDGHVGNLSIDQPSGHPLLDQAALDAVQNWEFTPQYLNGQPIRSVGRLPIEFVLRE